MDVSSCQWIAELGIKMMEDEYSSESLSSCTTDHPYLRFDEERERPTKMMKTSSSYSNDDSSPSSTSHLLSFSNFNNSKDKFMLKPKLEVDHHISGDIYGVNINKLGHEHVVAERRRRQKLSQRFITLSALIPDLKKMDKASVLGEAARYMKELQERIKSLEEKLKERKVKSVINIEKKTELCIDEDEDEDEDEDSNVFPEIQVRVMDKELILTIHSQNHKGLFGKVLNLLEKLQFCVTNTNSMPFGNFDFIITLTAQMKTEVNISPRDLVTKLRAIL